MELPNYHLPTIKSWWLHVWERISAYLKKATTIIFAASVVVWFLLEFGFANWEGGNGAFGFMSLMPGVPEYYTDYSLLAIVGNAIAWIFAPLGADTWQAAAASINALIAKENLVSTFGVIYGIGDATENSVTMWSGFAGMFTDASGILHVGAMCAFVASTCSTRRASPPSAPSASRWTRPSGSGSPLATSASSPGAWA